MTNSKPNFIMLIGSDGSGKTTIAEGLENMLRYQSYHFGPVQSYEEGKRDYFTFVEKTNTSVITDRFFEGEKIFAPLYRNYEADYFEELEQKMMEKFNVILVLVYAPYSVIKERLAERGEDFVKPQHFRYAYDKVLDIFNESSLPKMMIDTSACDAAENVMKILNRVVD